MLSALLTVWGWKMAIYVGIILALGVRLRMVQKARLRSDAALAASERALSEARAQIKDLGDQYSAAMDSAAQIRAQQFKALQSLRDERQALVLKLAAMQPPQDPSAAVDWLKSDEAKG